VIKNISNAPRPDKKIEWGNFFESDLFEATQFSRESFEPLRGASILIVGASGFVGSWLAAVLIYANRRYNLDYEVTLSFRSLEKMNYSLKLDLLPDVLNIQGDEPFIDPANIEKLISIFKKNPDVKIATLVCKIKKEDELFNPNCPKVILDNSGKAVYFSRTTIPFVRDFPEENWITKNTFYKHIGIYAYRKDVLNSIVNLPQSTWEKAESLEQLRWLQNGFEIFVAEVEESGISVDTEADLIKANDFAVKNQL
jgi:CMP-2-keto-3-deoxyoctulosonic acid synthetase